MSLRSILLLALLIGCPAANDDDANDDDSADDDDVTQDDDDATQDDDDATQDDDDATQDDDDATQDDDDTADHYDEVQGLLATTNSAGRTGAFFLPDRTGDPLPYLLLFHPTGGDGNGFLSSFLTAARAEGFAIVAPDSRVSPTGDFTWEVGTEPNEVTPDLLHAQACLEEVLAMDGAPMDADFVLAAGHSGGASSAPYLASNDARFTAFAVLHGGVFVGGLGSERPLAWLSTGDDDGIRPPAKLQGYADALEGLGFAVTFETFPGDHGVSEAERTALLDWWLSP